MATHGLVLQAVLSGPKGAASPSDLLVKGRLPLPGHISSVGRSVGPRPAFNASRKAQVFPNQGVGETLWAPCGPRSELAEPASHSSWLPTKGGQVMGRSVVWIVSRML